MGAPPDSQAPHGQSKAPCIRCGYLGPSRILEATNGLCGACHAHE